MFLLSTASYWTNDKHRHLDNHVTCAFNDFMVVKN